MLNEGRRRRERGTDVVVGFVETHGRARTAEQIGDLEVDARGARSSTAARRSTEMDVDAILRRRPEVVLVDELAHTNVPGSRNEKRWQDVEELLDAGIDVISTRQHPAPRVAQRRRRADHRHPPARDGARRRRARRRPDRARRHGARGAAPAAWPTATSTPPTRSTPRSATTSGPATCRRCASWPCCGSPTGSTTRCAEYRERHGITEPWETRERVVVALTGAPGADHLIRRAARIAQRANGELIGVHVVADAGLSTGPSDAGGDGDGRAAAAARGARRRVPRGHRQRRRRRPRRRSPAPRTPPRSCSARAHRSRWHELVQRLGHQPRRAPVRARSTCTSSPGPPTTDGRRRRAAAARRAAGPHPAVAAPAGCGAGRSPSSACPLITLAVRQRPRHVRADQRAAALPRAGDGRRPRRRRAPGCVVAVIGGFLLANWYFTPPFYEFTIADGENLLALRRVRRRRRHRRRARRPGRPQPAPGRPGCRPRPRRSPRSPGRSPVRARSPRCSASCASTFGFRAAALLRRAARRLARARRRRAPSRRTTPTRPTSVRDLGGDVTLALAGGELSARGPARAQRLRRPGRRRRRARSGSTARPAKAADLAAANDAARPRCCRPCRTTCARRWRRSRRRSPACASATSTGRPTTIDEFQATIEEETDRLTDLVGNLLDMSRLQASALVVELRPTGVEEVVLAGDRQPRRRRAATSTSTSPETLPDVVADAALLERALANLVANAVRVTPPTRRHGSPPARSCGDGDATSTSGSSTAAPASAPSTASWCSSRSSGSSTTRPTAPASASAGHRPRLRRGDGRRADHRGHTRRRHDDGRQPAGRGAGAPLMTTGARRRRRGADPPGHGGQPARPAATTSTSPRPASRRSQLAARHHPDVVLLDLGLPGMDGLEVIDGLRGWTQVPIVVLSARGSERDKVAALDAGADDYVSKPFGMDELLARLRAAVRRAAVADEEPTVVTTDDFTVDLGAKRVLDAAGEPVRLTPTEWQLLEVLVRHRGKLVTQRQLLQEVWGPALRRRERTTCASTSPTSAASSSPTAPIPATSSPSPAWATASSPPADRTDIRLLAVRRGTSVTLCRCRLLVPLGVRAHDPRRSDRSPDDLVLGSHVDTDRRRRGVVRHGRRGDRRACHCGPTCLDARHASRSCKGSAKKPGAPR